MRAVGSTATFKSGYKHSVTRLHEREACAMDEAGYQGYVVIEVSNMVQRRPDYGPFFHAQLGYWTLDKAFKVAGLARDDV